MRLSELAKDLVERQVDIILVARGRIDRRTAILQLTETDCVAGHVRFEPRNPSASYLIAIS